MCIEVPLGRLILNVWFVLPNSSTPLGIDRHSTMGAIQARVTLFCPFNTSSNSAAITPTVLTNDLPRAMLSGTLFLSLTTLVKLRSILVPYRTWMLRRCLLPVRLTAWAGHANFSSITCMYRTTLLLKKALTAQH